MGDELDPLAWAAAEAARLRAIPAVNQRAANRQADWATTLTFLRQQAPRSDYLRIAEEAARSNAWHTAANQEIAKVLEAWASATELGMAKSQSFEVRARVEAATDLMEQAEALLADRRVHPAAPIMLAGAALEELLRSLWERAGHPKISGKPGMNSYAASLQSEGVLDRQAVKDVTSMAGRRNEAAHGEFEKVNDPVLARLMVDQVNLFLQRNRPE